MCVIVMRSNVISEHHIRDCFNDKSFQAADLHQF